MPILNHRPDDVHRTCGECGVIFVWDESPADDLCVCCLDRAGGCDDDTLSS